MEISSWDGRLPEQASERNLSSAMIHSLERNFVTDGA